MGPILVIAGWWTAACLGFYFERRRARYAWERTVGSVAIDEGADGSPYRAAGRLPVIRHGRLFLVQLAALASWLCGTIWLPGAILLGLGNDDEGAGMLIAFGAGATLCGLPLVGRPPAPRAPVRPH